MVLAGEILEFFDETIASKGEQKMGVQFGAYATFASFFGLAGLELIEPNFRNIVDYASSMIFELYTNSSASVSSGRFPSPDEMYVRFFFSNGTATDASQPGAYTLFGLDQPSMSWTDFHTNMDKFAVRSTQQWCGVCGGIEESCAAYASENSGNDGDSSPSTCKPQPGNGLSAATNGVIGAMTTLVVVLGLEILIFSVGGYRLVSRKRLASHPVQVHVENLKGAA